MPWKEQRVMSQKLEFIEKAGAPGANISALCRKYGISRQTGHKWLRRFRAQGYTGLTEQSRRPHTSPLTTAEEVIVRILELRDRHWSWGPDKISRILRRAHGEDAPSKSTVARVLQRLGRMRKRRSPVRIWRVDGRPRIEVHAPNDLWTMDFKGWWWARNRERCEPLTVRDAFSRRVLAVALLESSRIKDVRQVLQRLFERHGLPLAIQSDNGTPFVNARARGGLSKLSVWLLSLGIRLVRSRPGCPQDNGGHERMHRDLSELERHPARTRRAQQRACDRWMVEFNDVRPHDALGGKTPAELYRNSERRSLAPVVPSYPPEWEVRRVFRNGKVSINGDEVFIGTVLAGQLIGVKREGLLRWRARFFDVDLGTIEIAPLDSVFTTNNLSVNGAVNPERATPVPSHRPGAHWRELPHRSSQRTEAEREAGEGG
jgi:transposase InsO family protein